MKDFNEKQVAGIWMDNNKACVITRDSAGNEFTILQTIKADDSRGGGSEHSMNNAKQGNSAKFYKSISALLQNYDKLLIFGPGKAQEQFKNHLEADAQFAKKNISIDSADQLTEPQMIAQVREFFK